MTDQIKKKWRPVSDVFVSVDDLSVFGVTTLHLGIGDATKLRDHIVAIHNAIIEAGIDPDKLVGDEGALKDLVKETSEICGYDGEVSGTCALDWVDDSGKSSAYVRDILDRLGVKG